MGEGGGGVIVKCGIVSFREVNVLGTITQYINATSIGKLIGKSNQMAYMLGNIC